MSYGNYRTLIESLARTRSSQVQIFADFCRMAACALALQTREDEYHQTANHYNSDELSEFSQALAWLIEEMEAKPFTDILGEFYQEIASHSSKQARGEFFTPPGISKLMASVLFDVDEMKAKGMPITVNEPTCGSGGMVLAIAELFAPDSVDLLRVTCQDINPLAADMCFINTTLWGIPTQVVLGDTLRMTETSRWKNLHWQRVGEDQRLAMREIMDFISRPPEPERNFTHSETAAPHATFREVNGQFELDLGSSLHKGAAR